MEYWLVRTLSRTSIFLTEVKDFDDVETRKVPGVRHVFIVKITVFATLREGVAVVADTLWAAMQGRKLLKVSWDDDGFEHWSTPQLYSQMRNDLKSKEGLLYKAKGNFEKTYKNAAKK